MMKMKRFISVVLLSLLASLFQGMSTANAAVAPGRPAFSGATCNGSYDIWNFTMTSTDTVTGFKYAFTDNLTSTAPTTLYDFAGTFTQSGNNFTIRFNYSDFVARGVGHGQVVRPWIQGVSSSEIGPVNNNSGLACTTDFVAPTLSSTSASLTSATSASLRFTSDDAGQWTHYYLVYESTDAAPTAETVIAQGAVSPTVAKGTSTSTSASRSVTVSGLTAGRSYTAYVVARDYGANTSTVSTIEIKIGTPDLAASSDLGTSSSDNLTSDNTPTFSVPATISGGGVITATKAGTSNVTCSLSSGSCTLGTLEDGTWIITATDSSATSNSLSVTIDTSVPTATLTAGTLSGSANATVQSSEAGTAYLVKSTVNVTSRASITSSVGTLWNSVSVVADTATDLSVEGLELGEYYLYVIDATGNLSARSTNAVTVSMGAPSTPDLNNSSDLGTSSTDNQTADDTPTFDFTGLAINAVVTVTATPSSGSPTTCAFTATSGSGSCTFSPALANGTYSVKASQTLGATTSIESLALSDVVIYRTNVITGNTLTLNPADDTGSSASDYLTSATTLRVKSTTGGVRAVASTGGNTSSSPCDSGLGCSFGTYSSGTIVTFTSSSGPSDSFGNPMLIVTINTSSPTLTNVGASSVTGTTANLNFTSDQAGTYFYLVLAASATAPDAATIIAQGTSVTNGTSSALASANTVAISGLSESTAYKTYLVVRHPAGGTSAVSNVAMTTTIAVPSVPDLAAGSDLGSSSTDNSTADNTPTVDLAGLTSGASVTVTATPSTGSPVTCTFTASGSTGSCTFSALTNGTYSVKVKQTVGGVDSADSVALTGLVINAQIISTPATPDLTSGSDLGSSATDNVTNDDTPTISVSGTFTGTAVVTATKAGSSDVTCTIVSGSCTLGTLADGTWSLTVTDSTVAGSTATSSALSLTIDTGRPTAALTTGTIFASGNASVQSSELGTAYLVRNSVTVSDLASITSQVGSVWNTVSIAAVNTATNLPATGLTAGTYLLYTVDAAGNLSLVSTQSVVIAVETPGTPGQPTVVAGDTQATITVVAPTSGDAPATYTIQASDSSGILAGKTCTVTGASGSCVVSGLTNGTAYTFTSTATNTGGTSSASSSSVSATPTDTPVAPQVSATAAPTGTLVNGNTLTSAVTFTGTPTPNLTYTWQRCTSTTELSTCVAISGATSATYVLTDTDAGMFVRSVVTATNGTGSIVGTSAITTSIAAIAASAPTSLSAVASDASAVISFTAGATGGAAITNYKYSTDGTNYTALSPADSSSPVTISGLTNGTAYTIYLKAVNSAGDSIASSTVSVTPVDNVAPTLTGAVLASNGLTLTLTFSEALNSTTAAAAAYAVTANGSGISVSSVSISGSTAVLTLAAAIDQGRTVLVSYTDPTTSNDANALQDAAGNDIVTFASQSVTNNSTNITIPGTPGTPTAVGGNSQATVTVVAPTTGGTPSTYTVTASPGGATCTVTGASGSCTVTGLTNGTAYTFETTATNTTGTSAASIASSAVTPTAPPAPAPAPEPVCNAACVAAEVAAAKASADAAAKVIAEAAAKVAAEKAAAEAKIVSDTAAKVVAEKVSVDKSVAEAAAKAAVDKAAAAAVAKATADAAAAQAAVVAKAAADAQAAAVEAASKAAAALKSATTTAAAKAAATASAAKAATTAATAVQAAATAAKAAATAKNTAANASKQVDIAIGALSSKTASASSAAQANAIAAAAKAAANAAAKAAADQAAAAKVASNNANKEATDAAARIATEQKEAADAAAVAKAAADADLKANELKIAMTTESQKAMEAVVAALNEKVALAEASVKAATVAERTEIDKKIADANTKIATLQRVADEAQVKADSAITAQVSTRAAAEAATQIAVVQANEAAAVKLESIAKTAVATKAAADASLAAKVATAAKAAAAKVPARAVISAKPSSTAGKNSAKATISGLKPGQKVKVTVNVKGK